MVYRATPPNHRRVCRIQDIDNHEVARGNGDNRALDLFYRKAAFQVLSSVLRLKTRR